MPAHPPNLTSLQGRPQRLRPPPHLKPELRATFVEITGALDAGHFQISDMDLLCAYVAAIHLEREAREHLDREGAVVDGKANAWIIAQEKAVRTMTALSLRLKIGPQARTRARVVATRPISYYDRVKMLEHDADERDT